MAVRYHIAQVMQQFLGEYRQQFSLSLQQRRVCENLMSCRTTQLEAQYWQCDHSEHMQTMQPVVTDIVPDASTKTQHSGLSNNRRQC